MEAFAHLPESDLVHKLARHDEPRYGFLADIRDSSRQIWGEHMVRILIDLVGEVSGCLP